MHSLLKYVNNKFEVDNIVFSNDIVLKIHPEYACEDNIQELLYQVANPNNCIYYKDGSVKSLSGFEPKYNELILLSSKFQFEENELLILEQAAILNKPKPSIDIAELFIFNITMEEQKSKIQFIKEHYPDILLNDEFYFRNLDRIKKGLLKNSDWTQLPDVQNTLSKEQKEAWINYRASLRNLDNVKNPLLARIPIPPF